MFNKIQIENFKAISKLQINDLKRVNVFVGKNNCGKTTILEAIFLLTGATNPSLPKIINDLRNYSKIDGNYWPMFFKNSYTDLSIKISGQMTKPDEKRELKITPVFQNITSLSTEEINNEKFNLTGKYSTAMSDINGLELEYKEKIAQRQPIKFVSKIFFEKDKLNFQIPEDYKVRVNGIFISATNLGYDSAKRFDNIQIKKETEMIVKILKNIEPNLSNITIGADKFIYCDIGLPRLVPINLLGNGMLRIFSINVDIFNYPKGIVLIDEIENGIDYLSQKHLWSAIIEAAKEYDVQIFATTHSYECIQSLISVCSTDDKRKDDIRLYRIERKDENFKSVTFDYNDLKTSLENEWEVR